MGCCDSSVLPETEFFKSNQQISVYFDSQNHVIYEPIKIKRRVGVIVYPGALANNKKYAEIAFNLSKNGYFVVLCKMPCNLSAMGSNRATDISANYSAYVDKWVLGGHSLGGIMSTKFLYENFKSKNPNKKFVGLFHLASRGYDKNDISDLSLETLVIYSELDGIIIREKIEESLAFLPKASTKVKLLEGANHSYFGDFPVGKLCCLRDNEAKISREEQIRLTIIEMLEWLKTF